LCCFDKKGSFENIEFLLMISTDFERGKKVLSIEQVPLLELS
jgi:hypothetical protein